MMVDVMYYAIMRRYQRENLATVPRNEWPHQSVLLDYHSIEGRDPDYYRPVDYFIPLGEWLHDYRARERRDREKANNERKPPSMFA